MGFPSNIVVTGPISVTDSGDLYPTHYDILGYGGLMCIDTITNRNAIPTIRRKFGMFVTVYNDPTPANNVTYRLCNTDLGGADDDLSNNSNWIEFNPGGGGHTIEEAGTPLNQRTNLNFGSGLIASDNDPDTDINLGGNLTQATQLLDSTGAFQFSIIIGELPSTDRQSFLLHPTSGISLISTADDSSTSSTLNLASSGIIYMQSGSGTLFRLNPTTLEIDLGSDATGDTYYRDASGNFTRLAIGSATSVLTGGTIPSYSVVSNGLTVTGGTFRLGGNLVANTTINNDGFTLELGTFATGRSRFVQTNSLLSLTSGGSTGAGISMDGSVPRVTIFYADGVGSSNIIIDDTQMEISDSNNSTGLKYENDYSSNFTVRSIPDVGYVLAGKTYTDNSRHIFNPGATNSGINIGQHTSDPSSPVNGDLYYNSTTHAVRGYINSTWVSLGAGGTVTSVALGGISNFITVGGSPIITSGTFSLSLNTQAANRLLIGPTSGADAVPTFRLLTLSDLPNITVEEVTSLTYTFTAADNKKVKRFTNVTSCTATVPVGLPSGWEVIAYRGDGAGVLTIASNGTLESVGTTLQEEKTAVSIFHRGSDVHVALGGFQGGGGSGSVTSVALDDITDFATATGSPISDSGTLGYTLNTQSANTILCGPTSGANAIPTFRLLVTSDLPNVVVEDVTTTTYTFVEADNKKVKRFTNASGCTVTIPISLTTGWESVIYRGTGAGVITIESDGILESVGTTMDSEETMVSVVHRGSNNHIAVGAFSGSGSGSVTSVDLTMPTGFLVTGNPITSSGSLDVTFDTQLPHAVLIGATSGITTPTFRVLDDSDLPNYTFHTIAVTTYTLTANDNKKIKRFTHASGCTVTIPAGLPNGWSCTLLRDVTGGPVTIQSDGTYEGVGNIIQIPGTSAVVLHRTSDVHIVLGALSPLVSVSGTSGQVGYFNGTNSIISEAGFEYDSGTNILSVPKLSIVDPTGLWFRRVHNEFGVLGPSSGGGLQNSMSIPDGGTAIVKFYGLGMKDNGAESYTTEQVAMFHRSGSTTIIVGTVTTLHEVTNSSDSPSMVIEDNGSAPTVTFSVNTVTDWLWNWYFDIAIIDNV